MKTASGLINHRMAEIKVEMDAIKAACVEGLEEATHRQTRTAEQLADWYCHTLRKAEAAADEREALKAQGEDYDEADAREQALLAEVEALQAEIEGKVDACAYVVEREKARVKAEDAVVKYYTELAAKARAKRERAAGIVDRVQAKLLALIEAQGGKSASGEAWRAVAKPNPWRVIPLYPEAPVPDAAKRIVEEIDKKALLALVNADAAPGWSKERTMGVVLERI